PQLADPHALLGYTALRYDWTFAESEREFARALTIDPNNALVHAYYAQTLLARGRRSARRDRAGSGAGSDLANFLDGAGRHARNGASIRGGDRRLDPIAAVGTGFRSGPLLSGERLSVGGDGRGGIRRKPTDDRAGDAAGRVSPQRAWPMA